DPLVPALDDAAQPEREDEGLLPVHRAVELGPVLEPPRVVDLDPVAGGRAGAGAGDEVRVPQARCGGDRRRLHAFPPQLPRGAASRTSCFPKFLPCSIPMNAAGAFSSPSTTSSRYLRRPWRTHSASWRRASSRRA